MVLYVVIATLASLALYLQWRDGHVGYGNTTAGMQLPRALWCSTAVLFGIAIDREYDALVAVAAGFGLFLMALWIMRRFEDFICCHGLETETDGRPLARLAQAEARLQAPNQRR